MFTRRELNSANHRFNMMNSVLVNCRSSLFEDLHVTAICKEAGVSKVTFFKYFSEKDDILLFYKSLLTIGVNLKVYQGQLTGRKALEAIVSYYGNEFEERPSLILGMVHKLLSGSSPYRPMRVTPAEKSVFFPDADFDAFELLSLEQLVEKCLLEGILQAEIKSSGNAKVLANNFLANLYGATVLSHVNGDGPDRPLFQSTVRDFQRRLL